MLDKDFNTKYAQYLEQGNYGLDINEASVAEFLDDLFESHLTKLEGFQYSQIKIKYGNARFYFKLADNASYDMKEAIQFLVESNIDSLLEIKDA
ncbi:MAG: hypothetical protein IM526_02535 [Microcystis sp. M38BS1]|uniref:hypothetical protein n=1 Tax=Microcystis sp. M38BS1 TaxID=2771188 RepID=UPI0031FDA477|nr:hypothetical protein [Microcystis sp. M38BS1]MCA6582536.1 hypothetical protein [Pseudanabaena sp. M34BS1SP1A06MG]